MPNATDIKYRIDCLDGGEFQTLCDAYLCCRGYGTGYSLGMKTGTNNLNDDYSYFKRLPLESSMWDASVPAMKKRIEYLLSLIPMLSGVEYIEHRLRVEKEIQVWEDRIKKEEVDQLLGWFA